MEMINEKVNVESPFFVVGIAYSRYNEKRKR
jgi:hypothetical protein